MEENNIQFENEMDIPQNWISNTVLIRDGKGNILELEITSEEGEEC